MLSDDEDQSGHTATGSEGLAQGSCVAARVGFETATLRTEGAELTTEPPQPNYQGLADRLAQLHKSLSHFVNL